MSKDSNKSYLSLTEVEVEGLHAKYSFADGHAYHDMPEILQSVLDDLGSVWKHAKSRSVPEMEDEFKRASAKIMGSSALATHPHYSISPTSSNSIDIASAWLNMQNHNLGLVEPVFDNLYLLLRRRKVRLNSIQETDLIDIEKLESKITGNQLTSLFVVTPNNPTGFQLSESQFKDICNLCARKRVALVVDTSFRLYSKHSYDTYKILNDSNVDYVVIEDTGKTWPTQDLKVGLMAYSGSIAKDMRGIYEEIFLCSSNFTLALLAKLMDKTHEAGVSRVIKQEAERRTQYVESVLTNTPLSVIREPDACVMPVTWLDCSRTGLTDIELVTRLREHNIGLLPGRFFYWNSRDQHTANVRLSLMRPETVFREGLEALSEALPKIVPFFVPLREKKKIILPGQDVSIDPALG